MYDPPSAAAVSYAADIDTPGDALLWYGRELNHTMLAAYPSLTAMQHNADTVELLHKIRTLYILLEI